MTKNRKVEPDAILAHVRALRLTDRRVKVADELRQACNQLQAFMDRVVVAKEQEGARMRQKAISHSTWPQLPSPPETAPHSRAAKHSPTDMVSDAQQPEDGSCQGLAAVPHRAVQLTCYGGGGFGP